MRVSCQPYTGLLAAQAVTVITTWDAPDIRPDCLAFFISGIRMCLAGYPAGYWILKIVGYPAKLKEIQVPVTILIHKISINVSN
jgi:hypothetical protein